MVRIHIFLDSIYRWEIVGLAKINCVGSLAAKQGNNNQPTKRPSPVSGHTQSTAQKSCAVKFIFMRDSRKPPFILGPRSRVKIFIGFPNRRVELSPFLRKLWRARCPSNIVVENELLKFSFLAFICIPATLAELRLISIISHVVRQFSVLGNWKAFSFLLGEQIKCFAVLLLVQSSLF